MNQKFILGMVLLSAQIAYPAINDKTKFNLNTNLNGTAITVAIIDTGADIKHQELEKFIWVNEGEVGKDAQGRDKATNGLDDDDNGFVDDIHGWNFVNNSNDVSDNHGHGTHIAGIIKKESQKHSTASTLNSPVRLMILKYYSTKASDTENIKNTVKAMKYALKMKANIINYSGGGGSPQQEEFEVIQQASVQNIVLVAAAGNHNLNMDQNKYYPASYNLNNIISVAASNNDGNLVAFSNYGQNSVDIAAPGKLIFSTLPNNTYGVMSGTSQATAFVSGTVAGLFVGKNILPIKNVISELMKLGRYNKTLAEKTKFQIALIN